MSIKKISAASAESLQEFLADTVPAISALKVRIAEYNQDQLIVEAPLSANINDKGTAFGGSLYNVCVMASWGMTAMLAHELNLEGDIVVAKGEIEYLRPSKADLRAKVLRPNEELIASFVDAYHRKGKAAITQTACVYNEQDLSCVSFTGKFAIVKS